MRGRAALVLLASALPGAGLAAEKMLYSFSVPSWQWTVDHPDKSVTIREMPDGYTSIRFHRPVIRGGINSQLEQEVWEDSTSYVVSDAKGKNLYCYCAADAGPSASMRAFLSREVYYFVDDTLGADPAKRQGDLDYPYQVVEVRRDRVARYACTFMRACRRRCRGASCGRRSARRAASCPTRSPISSRSTAPT